MATHPFRDSLERLLGFRMVVLMAAVYYCKKIHSRVRNGKDTSAGVWRNPAAGFQSSPWEAGRGYTKHMSSSSSEEQQHRCSVSAQGSIPKTPGLRLLLGIGHRCPAITTTIPDFPIGRRHLP